MTTNESGRKEASTATKAAEVVQPPGQPPIGRLMDEFSSLPILWGLNEPGALVRHSDVFKMLVAAGKTYLAAPTLASAPQADAAESSEVELLTDQMVGARYALRAIADGIGDPAKCATAAIEVIDSLAPVSVEQSDDESLFFPAKALLKREDWDALTRKPRTQADEQSSMAGAAKGGADEAILARQVADWTKERDRLQDLIDTAAPVAPQAERAAVPEVVRRAVDVMEGLEGKELPGALPSRIAKLRAAVVAYEAAAPVAQEGEPTSSDVRKDAESAAARDVLAERHRQIEAEGWTPEHDDEHRAGSIARAAAVYALVGASDGRTPGDELTPSITERLWPWGWNWFKPKSRRHNLVRAGALILAEIERIDRAHSPASSSNAAVCDAVWETEDGNMGDKVERCRSCGTYKGNPCRKLRAAKE